MTKTELIKDVAEETGYSQEVAKCIVNSTFDLIINAVGLGHSVTLQGFGEFNTRIRAPFKGRNPRTGAAIDIAGRVLPTFKAGSALKAAAKTMWDK